MQINFTIYGNPIAKSRPRFFRRGNFIGTYTDKKTRQREESVLLQALKYKPPKPIEAPIVIEIIFYFMIPKSLSKKKQNQLINQPCAKYSDIDNLIKAVLDPLNGVFWRDDRQIAYIKAEKRYSDTPRTEVKIQTGGIYAQK